MTCRHVPPDPGFQDLLSPHIRITRWAALGAALAVAAALLSGCATLSQEECRQGDWRGIGYADGAAGYQASRIAEHAEACREFGIAPDQRAYTMGRTEGLRVYCTPQNGFAVGRTGGSYGNVCPPGAADAFLSGYEDGQVVWTYVKRVNDARSRGTNAQNRVNEINREMTDIENRLAQANVPQNERDALFARLQRLNGDRSNALAEVRLADDEERNAQFALDQVRRQFQPMYGGGW